MPKISIILPTYNGEKYIRESIESIICQTFRSWELIIVNDCSTDNTKIIINEYAENDSRIKVIDNKRNKKLPTSLNIGFSKANGDYLTWTSDDNIFLPNALYEMNEYLDRNVSDIMVCARYSVINEYGEYLYKSDKYDLERVFVNNCVGACFMYRKEVVNSIGEYNADKFLIEDYDYWLRILFKYGNIGSIDKLLYKYRTHEISLTNTKKKEIKIKLLNLRLEYIEKIIEHLKGRKDLLCEIFYDFKGANMLEKNLENKFLNLIPELRIDCGCMDNCLSVVYGAGEYGKMMYRRYSDIIKCYVDKNKCGLSIYDKKIVPLSMIKELSKKYQILVATNTRNIYSMLETLKKNNINKCTVILSNDI